MPAASSKPSTSSAVCGRSAGRFLQQAHHQRRERGGHRRALGGARRDRLRGVRGQQLGRGPPGKRGLPGEHLVGYDAESVEIDPVVGRGIGRGLLRRHVGRRANRKPHRRERAAFGGSRDGFRDAEVGDLGLILRQQHVLRLDVAVDDPLALRLSQRAGDLSDESRRERNRQLSRPSNRARSDSPATNGMV
jgi:hypothetical protein